MKRRLCRLTLCWGNHRDVEEYPGPAALTSFYGLRGFPKKELPILCENLRAPGGAFRRERVIIRDEGHET